LCSVEILFGELAHARDHAFLQPSFLQPPRIEAQRILTGHATRAGYKSQIRAEISSSLPHCGGMKIQPIQICHGAQININRASDAVEARHVFLLHAFDVPECVGNVLNIEPNTPLQQPCSFATPVAKKMFLFSWRGLMAVWPTERVLMLGLGMQWIRNDQDQAADKEKKTRSQHAELQNLPITTGFRPEFGSNRVGR